MQKRKFLQAPNLSGYPWWQCWAETWLQPPTCQSLWCSPRWLSWAWQWWRCRSIGPSAVPQSWASLLEPPQQTLSWLCLLGGSQFPFGKGFIFLNTLLLPQAFFVHSEKNWAFSKNSRLQIEKKTGKLSPKNWDNWRPYVVDTAQKTQITGGPIWPRSRKKPWKLRPKTQITGWSGLQGPTKKCKKRACL